MKIKVNDQVKILKGKDRDKTGKVTQVFSAENRVVVEGLNLMKKHLRTRKQNEKGQIIELAAPLRAENVMLVCPKCGKTIRVGYKVEAGSKKRVCRLCKEIID